jgi:hypothetical protein
MSQTARIENMVFEALNAGEEHWAVYNYRECGVNASIDQQPPLSTLILSILSQKQKPIAERRILGDFLRFRAPDEPP